jgi:hypothetical protein
MDSRFGPIEGMIQYLRGEEGKLQSRYNELREAARSLDEAAFIEFKTTNSL